jgi:hypothetical protein
MLRLRQVRHPLPASVSAFMAHPPKPALPTASDLGWTRHPQRVAAGIPRDNRAGTLAESGIYSQQARKIRRLHVYAGKRVENEAAKGKMGSSRLLRE